MVAAVGMEAATMTQQITDADVSRDLRVVHLEVRQVIDDAVVPRKRALVYLEAEQRSGERFAVRCDREQCVLIDCRIH